MHACPVISVSPMPGTLNSYGSRFVLVQIDCNTDGLVDFTEFVAAALHVHQLEEHDSEKWQQRSRAAFEKFDLDRDGYITPDELRMVSGITFLHGRTPPVSVLVPFALIPKGTGKYNMKFLHFFVAHWPQRLNRSTSGGGRH